MNWDRLEIEKNDDDTFSITIWEPKEEKDDGEHSIMMSSPKKFTAGSLQEAISKIESHPEKKKEKGPVESFLKGESSKKTSV